MGKTTIGSNTYGIDEITIATGIKNPAFTYPAGSTTAGAVLTVSFGVFAGDHQLTNGERIEKQRALLDKLGISRVDEKLLNSQLQFNGDIPLLLGELVKIGAISNVDKVSIQHDSLLKVGRGV